MTIGSLLKGIAKELPDTFSMKSESVTPMLLKKGVKQEELDYSGIEIPEGKVTKEQLLQAEANRKDSFYSVTQDRNQYQHINLEAGKTNPSYREKVVTYSHKDGSAIEAPAQTVDTAAIDDALDDFTQANNFYYPDEGPTRATNEEEAIDFQNNAVAAINNALGREIDYDEDLIGLTANDLIAKYPPESQGSRYTSSHFGAQPDYLMHTRSYDDTMDGTPTRVLVEVQSDLHQQGRQQGYDGVVKAMPEDQKANLVSILENAAKAEQEFQDLVDSGVQGGRKYLDAIDNVAQYNKQAQEAGLDNLTDSANIGDLALSNYGTNGIDVDTLLTDYSTEFGGTNTGIPKSPLEKTWLRKGIEREMNNALEEGREQLAIPISGKEVRGLHRAAGVQKWYETQVLNTAKKIAKQTGSKFEVKEVGGNKVSMQVPTEVEEQLVKAHNTYKEAINKEADKRYNDMHPSDDVGDNLAAAFGNTPSTNFGVGVLARPIDERDRHIIGNYINEGIDEYVEAIGRYGYGPDSIDDVYESFNNLPSPYAVTETIDQLTDEYQAYATRHNLPAGSADELRYHDGIAQEHLDYADEFGARWDAAAEAESSAYQRLEEIKSEVQNDWMRGTGFTGTNPYDKYTRAFANLDFRGYGLTEPASPFKNQLALQNMVGDRVSGKSWDEINEARSTPGTTFAVIKPKSEPVVNLNAVRTPEEQLEYEQLSTKLEATMFDEVGLDAAEETRLRELMVKSADAEEEALKSSLPNSPRTTPNFQLYDAASPIAASFVAYQAYQNGMTEEQVNQKLTESYGFDQEDIAEVASRVNIISQASAAGMSMEEIKGKMEGRDIEASLKSSEPTPIEPEPKVKPTPKDTAFFEVIDEDSDQSVEDLVSSLQVLHPIMVSDAVTSIPAYFGNNEAQQRHSMAREASRKKIIKLAKEKFNVDLEWSGTEVGSETWMHMTPEGPVEVTPGFFKELDKVTGEIALGVTSAYLGGKTAFAAAPPVLPFVGFMSKPIFGALGAVTAGIAGAMTGSGVDYLAEAIELNQAMEAEALAYRSFNAAEAAAIGEILGYPIAKGLGLGWTGIVEAKNFVVGGQSKAAYDALKKTAFLTDDQITDIVKQMEKHADLKGNKYQKGVQAVALTEPGMQGLVQAASGTNQLAGSATVSSISSRAKEVLKTTSELTDEQAPRMLVEDLSNYSADVKAQYGKVKLQAAQSPYNASFTWDFEDLGIQKVMDDILPNITNPATRDKFLLQMQKVNSMSESRTFSDLIELRQMTNDFLYNKRVTSVSNADALRGVIATIDDAIVTGAGEVMERPDKWLNDWAAARSDYSKMKQVEKTAMYRALFDNKGKMRAVQPEQVIKALGKHITSIDGSFEEIMTMLPVEGRKLYEGAVIDSLANRFTAGVEQGNRAVHFPMLADELRKIDFTTPDARSTKKALVDLGETFKNDVYLAQTSGQISMPSFQSFLTTDPVVRAKFEIASGVFNYVKSIAPTDTGKQIALVRQTAKLLEKPLDAKNLKELTAELYDDVNLSKQVLELTQQASRDRMKNVEGTPLVKVFEGGKLKGSKQKTSIPAHRILTLKQARTIAEQESLNLDSKSLDAVLQQYGYKAILQGSDRVRILGDK